MYEALRDYYEENGLDKVNHTRLGRYELGRNSFIAQYPERKNGFAESRKSESAKRMKLYRESLTYDLYLRENVKNRPAFAGDPTVDKKTASAFYEEEAKTHRYLKGYEQYEKRQMRKMTHLEQIAGELLLFDYQNRNPLTNQAAVYIVN